MCGGADNNKPPCIHTPLQKESAASVSRRTRCAGPVLFADWSSVAALCAVGLQALLSSCTCSVCMSGSVFGNNLSNISNLFIYLSWWPVIMVTFEVSTTAHWRLRWGLAFFGSKIFFWLHHAAWGVLVPWPGIEPVPSAVKAWSPNHWTANKSQQ